MRMNTHKLMERSWGFLRHHQDENQFASKEEFAAEFEKLGEVAGDGRTSFFTRMSADRPFQQGNLRIVNVETPEDEERVIYPFVGGIAG